MIEVWSLKKESQDPLKEKDLRKKSKRKINKTKQFILIWVWNLAWIQFSWKSQNQFSRYENIIKMNFISAQTQSISIHDTAASRICRPIFFLFPNKFLEQNLLSSQIPSPPLFALHLLPFSTLFIYTLPTTFSFFFFFSTCIFAKYYLSLSTVLDT